MTRDERILHRLLLSFKKDLFVVLPESRDAVDILAYVFQVFYDVVAIILFEPCCLCVYTDTFSCKPTDAFSHFSKCSCYFLHLTLSA